ncbi:hypothetical protein GCM10010510_25130 [Streptomyces anandii JCM 4720]|nr:hypothetical protein GCM10010510_25130 [Streptomyces anandii JCM 4720]
MVAGGDRDRGVVSPRGRCRQVLLDCLLALKAIVDEGGDVRTVRFTDLLPAGYVWADHQLASE